MKSRILKQSGAAGLAAAVVLAGILLLPFGRGAAAHSEDEDEPRGRLEGTWRVQVTIRNCQTGAAEFTFASLLTFGPGGTLIEVTSNPAFERGQRTPGLGIWSQTGGHAFRAVSEGFILFPSSTNPPGFQRGVQRITQDIDVNGDEFTAKASPQFFDTNGVLLRTGCSTAVGKRFEEDKDKD